MSHTATFADKRDVLSNTQNRFNDKYRRNASLVKNYQNMLDARLSVPKGTEVADNGRVFKNSASKLQAAHQERVYRASATDLETGATIVDPAAPKELNLASYPRIHKPKSTIDM